MSTAFATLVDGVVASLLSAPAVAGGQVYANRMRPIPAQHNSAVVVRLEDSRASETVLGAHDWQTQIAIECYAKTGATSAEVTADALLEVLWPRLLGLQASLAGVMNIARDPNIEWERDSDVNAEVCATLRITVTHRTPFNSLEPWL